MWVWRLARAAFPALDGEGARLYGGRWNSPGNPVVYASASRALSVLERLVGTEPDDVPSDLTLFELELPDTLEIGTLSAAELDPAWRRPRSELCRRIGDEWIADQATPVLAVPSVIIPEESNYLVNPAHPESIRVQVRGRTPFAFDPRLLRSHAAGKLPSG
jgi:RES domain-containing protein